MPTTKDWSLIALLLVFAAMALVGTMDAQDAEHNHQHYCEMVAQWDKDAALGIAPEKRTGWPDFEKRNCK